MAERKPQKRCNMITEKISAINKNNDVSKDPFRHLKTYLIMNPTNSLKLQARLFFLDGSPDTARGAWAWPP